VGQLRGLAQAFELEYYARVRRTATFIVLLWISMICAPLVHASLSEEIPACCRMGGKHQCSMKIGEIARLNPDGRYVSASGQQCPARCCFSLPNTGAAIHAKESAVFEGLAASGACSPRTRVFVAFEVCPANLERGPPAIA